MFAPVKENLQARTSRASILILVGLAFIAMLSGRYFWHIKRMHIRRMHTPTNKQVSECDGFKHTYHHANGTHGEWVKDDRFVSQFHQDWVMYSAFFRQLELQGTTGNYIDIAAAKAKEGSNSYFYDICQGWNGICVEGNPVLTKELESERNCLVIPTCVADKKKQVSFTFASEFTGANGIQGLTSLDVDMEKGELKPGVKVNVVTMECTTLDDILEKAGHKEYQFMSLDVEGSEHLVLQGWTVPVFIHMIFLETRQYWKNSTEDIDNARSNLINRGYLSKGGVGWFVTKTHTAAAAVDEIWIHKNSPYLEKWETWFTHMARTKHRRFDKDAWLDPV